MCLSPMRIRPPDSWPDRHEAESENLGDREEVILDTEVGCFTF